MQPIVDFVQANLVLILAFALVAVASFTLGLMVRRRHVIQILPAPVSPGLERAISAALASREIVYVQPVAPSTVEPAPVRQAATPPSPGLEPAYAKPATGAKKALSSPAEIVHAIEKLADKIAHEAEAALDAAARDALLDILDHMEHHADDAWFDAMHERIAHATSNHDLADCAKEMIAHLHH
ncbi:MAG TPA: hypothetical protein VG889_20820 [Rhizomicrobium sp.]|nr:hypothetical protein [Rhizomicrobium sp.]